MSAAVAHTSIPRVPSTADAICGKSQQRDAAVKQLALVPMWKPLLVVLAQLWALRAISVDTHVRMRFGGLSLGATRRGYAICDCVRGAGCFRPIRFLLLGIAPGANRRVHMNSRRIVAIGNAELQA
jgi:hypothetical protein